MTLYLLSLIRTGVKGFSKKVLRKRMGSMIHAGIIDSYSCVEDFYFRLTRNKKERSLLCKDFEFSSCRFLWLINTASHSHWFQLRLLIDRILSKNLNLQNFIGFFRICWALFHPFFWGCNVNLPFGIFGELKNQELTMHVTEKQSSSPFLWVA